MPELNRWLQIVEMKDSVCSFQGFLDSALAEPNMSPVQTASDINHDHRLRRVLAHRSRLQTSLR
jgi:hypothetical protein